MDMLKGEQIAEANLTDWRKLAQGLHARFVIDDFGTGARFVAAVGEAGDALGHHPSVSIGKGYVDFKLVSDDAIYRDDAGNEHVVEWVTQQVEVATPRGSKVKYKIVEIKGGVGGRRLDPFSSRSVVSAGS